MPRLKVTQIRSKVGNKPELRGSFLRSTAGLFVLTEPDSHRMCVTGAHGWNI
jgi:hypothetical protein